MSDLKPCPFCGGEAHILKDGLPYVVIECVRCFGRTNCNVTEAEAIAAWNTRAERTCECIVEYAKSPLDGKTIVLHRCSSCNDLMRPHMNYCPNCGAKVTPKHSEILRSEVGE